MNESIWSRMLNLDRRWIFLLIGIVCIVPFFIPFGLPVIPTPHVISIFDYIENLGPENAIFISFDFDPGTDPENMPMAVAVMRHAFSRNIPVFFTANAPLAQGMLEAGFSYVTNPGSHEYFHVVSWQEWASYRERGIVRRDLLQAAWEADGNVLPEHAAGWVFEGRDFAKLGYLPYFALAILGMTSSIAAQYPEDMNGNPLAEMPMLQEHKSLREVDLATTFSGTAACMWWVTYAREKIGLPVAFGVTAVSATDYTIYIQSGQLIGQMGGLRGAAEYEVLLSDTGYFQKPDRAFIGMDVQNAAHLLILFFILLGNIAYFAGGFHKKGALLKGRR